MFEPLRDETRMVQMARARDLLGWKRRVPLLLAVGLAGLWPLVTLIAFNKHAANARLEPILAPYPIVPDLATNGPMQVFEATEGIPLWGQNPDLHRETIFHDALFLPGGRLDTYIAASEGFWTMLPEILAAPDRRWPRQGPFDSGRHARFTTQMLYGLHTRLFRYAHDGNWTAYREAIAHALAAADFFDPENSPMSLHRSWAVMIYIGSGHEYISQRYGWEMPPELHDYVRGVLLAHPPPAFGVEPHLSQIAEEVLAMELAICATRMDVIDPDEPQVRIPLALQLAPLSYRGKVAEHASKLAFAREHLVRGLAQEQYYNMPQPEFRRRGSLYMVLHDHQKLILLQARRALRFRAGNHSLHRLWIAALDAAAYRREHGTWPATIDDLGEPELRVDPFSPDGKPLRMRVDEVGRLRIWSLDADQLDNNGWLPGDPNRGRGYDSVVVVTPPGWRPAALADQQDTAPSPSPLIFFTP